MNTLGLCPACKAACRPGARFCSACGAALPPGAAPLPPDPAPFAAPPAPDAVYAPPPGSLPQYSQTYQQQIQGNPQLQQQYQAQQNPAGYGLVPYKNGQALAGYYMGCLSFVLPILAPFAVVFGILGFMRSQREPLVKGSAHGIIGIIAGVISAALWILLIWSWSSY